MFHAQFNSKEDFKKVINLSDVDLNKLKKKCRDAGVCVAVYITSDDPKFKSKYYKPRYK